MAWRSWCALRFCLFSPRKSPAAKRWSLLCLPATAVSSPPFQQIEYAIRRHSGRKSVFLQAQNRAAYALRARKHATGSSQARLLSRSRAGRNIGFFSVLLFAFMRTSGF
jgi:hypothetical protein